MKRTGLEFSTIGSGPGVLETMRERPKQKKLEAPLKWVCLLWLRSKSRYRHKKTRHSNRFVRTHYTYHVWGLRRDRVH